MKTPFKLAIDGEQRFVAVVVAGDAAAPARLWVCVAPDDLAAGRGWAGCWSSGIGNLAPADALAGAECFRSSEELVSTLFSPGSRRFQIGE